MPRTLKVAAAQMGPIHLTSKRPETLSRMLALLRTASKLGAQLVLFPETAFTTFFPRHLINSQEELDSYFEHEDNVPESANTKPLFDEAKTLGIDISIGFAERTADGKGYNTSIYFSAKKGEVIAKYRKVHLPGTKEPFANPDAVNQLEKRYFEPGNLGFKAFRTPDLIPGAAKKESGIKEHGKGDPIMGMMICNDRRWAEGWRCYGLQGVEIVLCGYNTAGFAPDLWGTRKPMIPEEAEKDAVFHHKLVMQGNSYMNSCFSISAAKAGLEDAKYDLIGGSCITSPEGHVLAEAKTKDDEVVFAEIDLEDCRQGKEKTFDFDRHRRVDQYGPITIQTGVVEPELL
ncbi:N-carbamoyl-D-amino acid hydrolase [Mollisia scopiformis]|uniref:N-carbamoyl-D-amino acid hydrolase n=1 Tax=Mollisia scopiformis TaxID=149040 RepID=A0A132B7R3_MOLSC|nr:N-carbamoyl-D-amino acid hydrolase [Mollisia scopiformis]KUJ08442.1 N-carbamoyl-D-amino acid hydrolase [Mollisia scopiformis]